jgi:sn-glycerol 3-phosphate transport system substrate-binding protein
MRPRATPLLLSLLLLASACGGSGGGDAATGELPACPVDALDTATEPVEVVVWHTQQARQLDTLEALVDRYNGSQSEVRVRLESQGASYEELQRKFEAAVPSRELPALVVFDDTATQTMADSGVILPAQACIDADGYDTSGFLEVAKNYYTIDDVLWAGSANLGSALLYYNKGHFAQAGLDPEDPPETLAEVRAAAEQIKAAGVVENPLVHEFASWKTEFWLTGVQAPMVDNDNGRGPGDTVAGTFTDNNDALELFSWFKEMQDDGLLRAIPHTPGQIDQYLAVANRQASMLVESSSSATSVEAFLGGTLDTDELGASETAQDVSGLDIGASVFPGLHDGGGTQMGGAAWYITSTTPDEVQAGAWDFLQFMNTAEAQSEMLIGGSYLPYVLAANDLPAVQQFFASGLSGRWLKVANDEVQSIDPTFPGPLIGPYYDFRREVEQAQDELMLAGATPEGALRQAQDGVTATLDRYNQGASEHRRVVV